MKKRPTKRDVRNQLEQEIEDFLKQGGEVKAMPHGASGLVDGRYGQALTFEGGKEQRTPVDHALKSIDQRKEQNRARSSARPATPKKPRKKIIYDDFGEPVRIVWEE